MRNTSCIVKTSKTGAFTVQEAAAILDVHKHTVQARLRDGTLKGKKLGGVWRIYRDSLVNDKVAADLNIERR